MYQGGLARFDKASGKMDLFKLPDAWQADGTQLSMVTPTMRTWTAASGPRMSRATG